MTIRAMTAQSGLPVTTGTMRASQETASASLPASYPCCPARAASHASSSADAPSMPRDWGRPDAHVHPGIGPRPSVTILARISSSQG